eukprot:4623789-Pyramimonas_sp.AAC.2
MQGAGVCGSVGMSQPGLGGSGPAVWTYTFPDAAGEEGAGANTYTNPGIHVSLASLASHFMTPVSHIGMGITLQADRAKRNLSRGEPSDHAALFNAYRGWCDAHKQAGGDMRSVYVRPLKAWCVPVVLCK